jgi:tetratricopeptide (TPR) repeat protein
MHNSQLHPITASRFRTLWAKAALLGALACSLCAPAHSASAPLAPAPAASAAAEVAAELRQQLEQEKDAKRQLEIQSLKDQVAIAVNNSQKAADWWINAAGVFLALIALLTTLVSVFIPWYLTKERNKKLEEQEKRLLAQGEQLIQSEKRMAEAGKRMADLENSAKDRAQTLQSTVQQAQDDAAKINALGQQLEQASKTDPTKVSPGTDEARLVQNALAAASKEIEEDQPPEVQLRLRALDAQAKNKWLDALSFWEKLLAHNPQDGKTLLALANAQTSLANQQTSPEEQKRLYEAAIAHYQRAAQYLQGLEHAEAQNNLGAALQTLGERESGTQRLEEAVAAFREALKERTQARSPLDWAATQNNLGNALQSLGERTSGTQRLHEAVAAFREVLKEHTQARSPLDWAATQNNLGNALATLGERTSGTQRLHEAVAAFREALKEHTQARSPLDWAATQNNLGNALAALGERESGAQRLEEAVAASREALKERTQARSPLDWAATQNNLGNALQSLGERTSGADGVRLLEEALSAFSSALPVFEQAHASHYVKLARENLAKAQAALAQRRTS